MLERSDIYTVKLELHYVLGYLQGYTRACKEKREYMEKRVVPEKISILDNYVLTRENYTVRLDDIHFRTK
jgi:hypothetical protein